MGETVGPLVLPERAEEGAIAYATDKLYGPNHKSIRALATILINATVDTFLVPSNIALRFHKPAMMQSCKEMAQCYKQLVSAVVKQSERDSSRTLETSEISRLIMQRQQAQEEKLAEESVKLERLDEQGQNSKKLDQQAQRMDQVLSLPQGLYESNSTK